MFQGSMVALVTPMAGDGAVDFICLEMLAAWHLAEGTDALVVVGTTGEAPTLEPEEQVAVIREAVRVARGRIPVIAGTGSNSTQHTIHATRAARAAGAVAALVVVPYYNRPTQEGMFQHFSAVAAEGGLPVIVYNVPGRTVADMAPETVIRLSQVPGIVGIKEATGEVARVGTILAGARAGFEVYSGDDATAREAMLAGARGVISVTANVAPAAMHRMCVAALAGDAATAAAADAPLAALHRELFCEANPIPVKWALAERGLIRAGIRLPLTPLASAYHPRLRAALDAAGLPPIAP
jgi:4-hydroxy-tetrahydrodipicolinate synthase